MKFEFFKIEALRIDKSTLFPEKRVVLQLSELRQKTAYSQALSIIINSE